MAGYAGCADVPDSFGCVGVQPVGGAEDLVAHAEKKLGCRLGESTADGRVYLKREEECVAACCGAPEQRLLFVLMLSRISDTKSP